MKCVLCREGETSPGKVTVTLERGGTVIVIKEVPAEVCSNCGEYYLAEEITREVLRLAEAGKEKGVEVEVIRFAA
ncbi:MAG: type II toxin-antitoxin system MqsA family antitoxin [Candidatus Hydrogenedentes bacterium]|jgi:YgiT-type zinc finger domain-containing protein|nr:type II toxin-antitoxin system MqsA family antitoxin [Candidatus Hydrogenedentota bacterium]